jgi:hypothetical protein
MFFNKFFIAAAGNITSKVQIEITRKTEATETKFSSENNNN